MKAAVMLEMQDRCWAVPTVASLWVFLLQMVFSSSGLLYVFFMEMFNVSHEDAAWPIVCFIVVANSSGLLVSILQEWLKPHSIAMLGSTLACAGLIVCSIAPTITWMTVAYGGLCGIGSGITMMGLTMYITLCFDKYRATAIAFKFAGWAVSGIVGPSVVEYLARSYGPSGSLLLSSAFAMHALPLAMLVRNPQHVTFPAWRCRTPQKTSECSRTDTSPPVSSAARGLTISTIQFQIAVRDLENDGALTLRGPYVTTETRNRTWRDVAPKDKKGDKEDTKERMRRQSLGLLEKPHTEECKEESRPRNEGSENAVIDNAHSFLANYHALFNAPAFYVFLFSIGAGNFSALMHETTIVEYATDKGAAALAGSNQLLTYTASGQLVGRVVLPFLSDKMSISHCALTAASFTVASACLAMISCVDDYVVLVALNSILGICEGYVLCSASVLIVDYLGVERLGPFYGLQGVCMIPTFLGAPSIIGMFRDKVGGSYDYFYWLLAAMNIFAATLTCGLYIRNRLRRKSCNVH